MAGAAEMVEDWSLQAIVRGSSGDFTRIVDVEMDGHDSFHHHRHLLLDDQHEGRVCDGGFHNNNNNNIVDELEELYKPFLSSNCSDRAVHLPVRTVLHFQDHNVSSAAAAGDHHNQPPGPPVLQQSPIRAPYSPKYKRRKNQQKRVVIQVSAEGLSSDMWAWRKYGQKPIKGSPYPRSYYRCSSSKGCLARKQVEQSCTDPGMFILTYTGDHSHTQPTRRNSLAGTVRQKFPNNNNNNNSNKPSSSSSSSSLLLKQNNNKKKKSPNSNTTITTTKLLVHPISSRTKEEEEDDHEFMDQKKDAVKMVMPAELLLEEEDQFEFGLDEDFFSGLEEFNDFIIMSDLSSSSSSSPNLDHQECHAPNSSAAHQFPLRSCSC
ncbi:WRKY transcription factor 22-like [Andrographis paniculata]|uniref:WRKY transcription factor 22-like n=1 Tax=Andrographis paniculata TaxID=175694 RepID=UPI0021E75595|nr:WRKY transcription factor 22-like [Andrographis paniculata]